MRRALRVQESLTPASQLAAGRTLFVQNCSSCHGIDAAGGLAGATASREWVGRR